MVRLKIQSVNYDDIPQIREIEEETFIETYPKDLFIMVLEMCKDTFLVSKEDNKVIGYIIGYLRDNAEGHVMSVATHPDYRSQGVGTKLIREDMKRLKEKGANRIGLEVRISNQEAIKLYERMDFRKTKRVQDYYQNGEDAWYMVYRDL